MESIAWLVKDALPNYLHNLPIPDSFGGWFKLSGRDWLSLLPVFGGVGLVIYAHVRAFKPGPINPSIDKKCPKVATMVDMEDLGEKTAFCRCWRSSKFPYCDGTHGKFNKVTGDNVGPVVIKKNN